MSKHRGSTAVTGLFMTLAAAFILGGILLVGIASQASPPTNLISTTTSSNTAVTTVTSTSSTITSTTSSSSATTTAAAGTYNVYVSALGFSSQSGCNSPTGPYPSYCNNVNLVVSVSSDGMFQGYTSSSSSSPSLTVTLTQGQSHTISCGTAAGYTPVQTTFTVTQASNPYIQCTYQTPAYTGPTTSLTVTVTIYSSGTGTSFPSGGDIVTVTCPPSPASPIYIASVTTNSQGVAVFNAPQNTTCQAADKNAYGTQIVVFSITSVAPPVSITYTTSGFSAITLPIVGQISISNAQAIGYGLMVGGVIAFIGAFSVGRGARTRHN